MRAPSPGCGLNPDGSVGKREARGAAFFFFDFGAVFFFFFFDFEGGFFFRDLAVWRFAALRLLVVF